MKDTLVNERGEGWESKRKHEATTSEFKNLQKAYKYLESEKDALVLSVTITEGEKKDIESNILELEAHRSAVNKQTEEMKTQAKDLEVLNQSL